MSLSPTATIGPDAKTSLLIEILQGSTAIWRAELGHMSNETVVWQPFNRSHSVGGILLHMADVESHFMQTVIMGVPRSPAELALLRTREFAPQSGLWPEPPAWPLQKYYEVQDRIRARTLSTLQAIANPEKLVTCADGEVSVAWIINYLISHEAYHAGQIALHKIHHGWGGREPEA